MTTENKVANENAIPRTWECFRAELAMGMKIDGTIVISDRMIYQHHHYRIKVQKFEKREDGSLTWVGSIQEDNVELFSCGAYDTIHEAYHDARAALAHYLVFNSFDYIGLDDADTLGAV